MRVALRWLLPVFALFLLSLNRPTLADDSLWQKFVGEAKQLREEKRYPEAEKQMLLGLAEAESFGPEDRRLAVTLNELAALYHASLRLNEAEPLYRTAVRIWEKFPACLEQASGLSNLARLCLDRGNYAEVEPLLRRALSIQERKLGPEHPDVSSTLNTWATLRKTQGHYADAERLFRRALSIRTKTSGENHPAVAALMNNLAEACLLLGRSSEATRLYRQA